MSWEETGTRSIPCPCGKGVITRTDYMDDWNRSEEKYSIECPECRAKYKFVSQSYYKHAGDSGTVHYLLDANYDNTEVRDKQLFFARELGLMLKNRTALKLF